MCMFSRFNLAIKYEPNLSVNRSKTDLQKDKKRSEKKSKGKTVSHNFAKGYWCENFYPKRVRVIVQKYFSQNLAFPVEVVTIIQYFINAHEVAFYLHPIFDILGQAIHLQTVHSKNLKPQYVVVSFTQSVTSKTQIVREKKQWSTFTTFFQSTMADKKFAYLITLFQQDGSLLLSI